MHYKTIRRVRMEIEDKGYFVTNITDEYIKCMHHDDKQEKFYYIYPNENGYEVLLEPK